MDIAGPWSIAVAALLSIQRYGLPRTLVLGFVLTPVYLYALPPVTCGCMPSFRRCDNTIRYEAYLKSDLKNLASQQEIYWSDYESYSDRAEGLGFVASHHVDVTIVSDGRAWSAMATHAVTADGLTCGVYVGPESLLGNGLLADTKPGEIFCTRDPVPPSR